MSLSAYGTLDQDGNVWEWNETAYSENSSRGWRGGAFDGVSSYLASDHYAISTPNWESNNVGFRVVYVPEPRSLLMTSMITIIGLLYWCVSESGRKTLTVLCSDSATNDNPLDDESNPTNRVEN
jgi:hypothetical protein